MEGAEAEFAVEEKAQTEGESAKWEMEISKVVSRAARKNRQWERTGSSVGT